MLYIQYNSTFSLTFFVNTSAFRIPNLVLFQLQKARWSLLTTAGKREIQLYRYYIIYPPRRRQRQGTRRESRAKPWCEVEEEDATLHERKILRYPRRFNSSCCSCQLRRWYDGCRVTSRRLLWGRRTNTMLSASIRVVRYILFTV